LRTEVSSKLNSQGPPFRNVIPTPMQLRKEALLLSYLLGLSQNDDATDSSEELLANNKSETR
jgi:hypothetical protein